MKKVIFEKDGRIGRITLNRPEKLNAIDDDVPGQLQDAVLEAEGDSDIHVIVLSGKGKGFCGGYDLGTYAENQGENNVYQGRNGILSSTINLCGIIHRNLCHSGDVQSQSFAKSMGLHLVEVQTSPYVAI